MGLHEKHAVATSNLGTSKNLLEDKNKARKLAILWPSTQQIFQNKPI
jgi:hypothetical protein